MPMISNLVQPWLTLCLTSKPIFGAIASKLQPTSYGRLPSTHISYTQRSILVTVPENDLVNRREPASELAFTVTLRDTPLPLNLIAQWIRRSALLFCRLSLRACLAPNQTTSTKQGKKDEFALWFNQTCPSSPLICAMVPLLDVGENALIEIAQFSERKGHNFLSGETLSGANEKMHATN